MAVPSAPTDVSATENQHDKVTITWTKSAGATGYEVYADGVGVSGRLGDVATFDHVVGAVPRGGTKTTVGNNTLHSYTTKYPKFLCNFDGADGATADLTAESGQTVSLEGNACLDTAQKKFGTASLYCDGTGGYATVPDHADWNFGTGDFTIDTWVRVVDLATARGICGQYVDADNSWGFAISAANGLAFYIETGGDVKASYVTSSFSPVVNTWYHLELARQGTNIYMFVNGVLQPLTANTPISTNEVPDLAAVLTVGNYNNTWVMNGWIDEFRISKGTCLHSDDFTVPVEAIEDYELGTTYFWSPVAGKIQVECWGAGGSGGGGTDQGGGAGGGGGAYARTDSIAISAGVLYQIVVGKGGAAGNAHNGTDSTFNINVVVADGGLGANGQATIGTGGTTGNSTGETKYAGGNGGAGHDTFDEGAGGGGAGGKDGAGKTAANSPPFISTDGGDGDNGYGGAGGENGDNSNGGVGGSNVLGGGGGGGGGNGYAGGAGGAPGGGGGGGEIAGGAGADGQVVITYVTANFVGTSPGAPSITAGDTVATDGTHTDKVALSLSGTTLNSGTVYSYTVKAVNDDGLSAASSADNGARVSSLNYQWKKSVGDAASGYNSISGATSSTYDDEDAPEPVIVGGTAAASDGTDPDKVILSVSGHSISGEGRYYYCELTAQSCTMVTSTANRGYRRSGNTLTYQWYRSAADSDADYSAIDGGTTNPYNDTGAP